MTGLEAVASAAVYLTGALFVGALVCDVFLLPDEGHPLRRDLIGGAGLWLGAFLLAAVFWLAVQGAKLSGGAVPTLDTLVRYLTRTDSGRLWLWREVYGGLLLVLFLSLRRGPEPERIARWIFFLALPLVASRSLASHASAVRGNSWLAIAFDATHLAVSALWAGGLPVLFWMLWRGRRLGLPVDQATRAVARFSRLALPCVAVLILTGFYQSWLQLEKWSALFQTPYGRVLLLKVALFTAMAVFGAVNRFFTLPHLIATAEPPLPRVALARIGAEAIVALVVFCVTGFLTVLPPGVHSGHQLGAAALPVQPSADTSIQIISPKPGDTFTSDRVPITFKITGGFTYHAHAYVDGELMGMFEGKSGTLTGVPPGRHTLELHIVGEDHMTEFGASNKVEFVVK